MPASRKDIKSPRMHRRDNSSPILADGNGIPSTYDYNSESDSSAVMSTRSGTPASVAGTDVSATAATAGMFNDEQLKLRAMIPALTPAHGPESTASAILAALSLGNHRPNSHTRRKSEGHVNRPPNAFIVFRRAQVQNMPANVTQHQQRISNLTALFWRVLTHSEQNTWYSLADDIKRLHNILFPDYNFNPRNPDGSKKATVPRGGLTPERLDFAWNEAQLLIQKHTVMGDHPPAPPASSTGKITRPKAPRKGQGTRAKERREREAAEREASHQAVARAAAITTATMASNNPLSNEQLSDSDDALYLSDQFSASGYEHSSTYFAAPIEEERGSTPDHESAIAWRPDFSLEVSLLFSILHHDDFLHFSTNLYYYITIYGPATSFIITPFLSYLPQTPSPKGLLVPSLIIIFTSL
ncbi:hypothetical protein CPB86DRAFT_255913 [Serendipita vermifera]|nr:hypothetical protein CPB86DRAFT_255913 [Serendipita vermifera]